MRGAHDYKYPQNTSPALRINEGHKLAEFYSATTALCRSRFCGPLLLCVLHGLNNTVEAEPAEYFLDDTTSEILLEMQNLMAPDIVIYDLPPALAHDDVVAFLPQLDAVLLVVGGGITTAEHVHKTERLLGDSTPLLGTVLNMAEGPTG